MEMGRAARRGKARIAVVQGRQPARLAVRCLWLLPLACLGPGGCANFWDDVTARDFNFKTYFGAKPDPLVVLRDSTDGNQRAKALAALHEPEQLGGSVEEQDVVVKILVTAATQDRQPWCRRAAIATMGTFKDPRVVDALRDSYYSAGSFTPEIATVLRCQALEALGKVGNPAAVDFLVKVLREPPVEGAEQDKQQKTDERIAAARALGNFKHYQGTSALVEVLKTEQDVSLRESARVSLVSATGIELPADARQWDELLHQSDQGTVTVKQEKKLFGIVPVSW
jgi:HEAT repeats/PBS lyase HEAT-like repeat